MAGSTEMINVKGDPLKKGSIDDMIVKSMVPGVLKG